MNLFTINWNWQTNKKHMKKNILRYLIFVILIIMSLGLLVILDGFEIRSKTSINLFVLNDSTCKSYMAYSTDYYPQKGDTIEICQTIGGDISFVIKDKRHEPANLVFLLESTDKNINMPDKLSKNSFTSGFIFTDKIKLRELILKKLSF